MLYPELYELEPDARVLVCTVNDPRDLEIARWDHWFRIPVRHAPPDFMAEALAFYLTAAYGDERWAVHEWAHVRGHELVRRIDLFPDDPTHPRSDDLYYKMQIGPLQRLPRPVPSLRWRRFTFITTSGERMMNALELGDLVERPTRHLARLMDSLDHDADTDET